MRRADFVHVFYMQRVDTSYTYNLEIDSSIFKDVESKTEAKTNRQPRVHPLLVESPLFACKEHALSPLFACKTPAHVQTPTHTSTIGWGSLSCTIGKYVWYLLVCFMWYGTMEVDMSEVFYDAPCANIFLRMKYCRSVKCVSLEYMECFRWWILMDVLAFFEVNFRHFWNFHITCLPPGI